MKIAMLVLRGEKKTMQKNENFMQQRGLYCATFIDSLLPCSHLCVNFYVNSQQIQTPQILLTYDVYERNSLAMANILLASPVIIKTVAVLNAARRQTGRVFQAI